MIPALLALSLATVPVVAPTDDPFPVATPESQGLSSEALAELAAELGALVEEGQAVGAELLVVKNRRTVLHEAFGQFDVADERPWEPNTVCNIRSMTKPLTGAALQILVDREQVELDHEVSRYLPGFDTDAARNITIRQVMSHRGGLPLTVLTTTLDRYPSLVEMANAVGERGPELEPGSQFWYSDAGTDVIGAIVELVSGKTLDAFVHEELLEPLGMTSSFYYLDDEDARRSDIASLYVGGPKRWMRFYDPDTGAFYPYAWGSQSLYSTTTDYARFLAMWMDDGRVGERRVLSEAAVERALTPVSEMSMLGSEARFPTSFRGLEVYYGQMAVLHVPTNVKPPTKATIFGHSGSDGTVAWCWPERDLMVLVFTQSRGGGAVLRIEEPVDRLLLHPEAYAEGEATPEEHAPYVGTFVADWAHHMREELVVQSRGGKLQLDIPSLMVVDLEPLETEGDDVRERRWAFSIAKEITVWFDWNEAGEVDCLRIRQGSMTFEAPRKDTPHMLEVDERNRVDPDFAARVIGEYDAPDSESTATILMDAGYLAVRNEAGQLLHLWNVPGTDVWQVRENPTMSLTFQLRGGTCASMTRHGPDGGAVVYPRVE